MSMIVGGSSSVPQDHPPEKVLVLDLETSKLVRGEPQATPLAFVGTMTYELRDARYRPGPHRCFLPDELAKLEELLRAFGGVVLGHNILNFDYEVLEPRISLEGVREKTVDTLGFLYEKRSTEPPEFGGAEGSLEGLSLDNLARRNLGRGKAISGKSIPMMWRQGRRDEVIAHNKEDLILTFSLWLHMVEGHTVVLGDRGDFGPYGGGTVGDRTYEPWRIEIFPEDLPRLTGRAPLYNTRVVRISGGPPLEEPPPDADDEPGHWYLGASARHYLRENELMISDPRIHEFGGDFETGPYPADWFTLAAEHEGPHFPGRHAPGEEPIDMDDL